MVRAVAATAYGGPEVIGIVEVPSRAPEPGEVVVEVRAASLNPWDAQVAAGALGRDPGKLPLRLGGEAAGVVTAVGAEAEGADGALLAVGDEVFGLGLKGAQAAELTLPASKLLRKPPSVGFAEAAGALIVGTTAVHALAATGVGEGDVVLVHGASGGVGGMVTQLARIRGARVIGTASARRHDALRAAGVEPVEYGDGLVERVRAIAPDGVTAAIDTVGTDEAVASSLELLADRARFVTIAAFDAAQSHGLKAIGAGPGADRGSELRAKARFELRDLLAEGRLRVDIAREVPLADARSAYELLTTGHAGGKIVLIP